MKENIEEHTKIEGILRKPDLNWWKTNERKVRKTDKKLRKTEKNRPNLNESNEKQTKIEGKLKKTYKKWWKTKKTDKKL